MHSQPQIPLKILVQQLRQIPGIRVDLTAADDMTFGTWAQRWLDTYKKGVVKDNTFRGTYSEPVMLHLIPQFGERGLNSITPTDVQEYFKSLRGKYALETQKKIRCAMWQIYEMGIEENVCYINPVRRSLSLVSDIPPAVKHTWSQAEYETAYRFALGHPAGLAIVTLMETAITRSELLGLTWEDLDLGRRVLTLRNGLVSQRSTVTGKTELVHQGLKNAHRHREIPISPQLAGLFALEQRAAAALKVRPTYIFHAPKGGPYDPNNWYRRVLCRFMRDLHEAHPEVGILTTHELRHTRATLLKNQGKDIFSIARLLGHSDLDMLSKRYAHDDLEALRASLGL